MSQTLMDYLSGRHKPQNVNEKHKSSFGLQDRIALFSTSIIGTMYAVYFTCIFLLGWMFWQTYITSSPIDPYPFAFLLFIASVAQLPIMSLIMVGQNLQGRHAELRAEEEFKTTNSSSRDIEKILTHLDKQDQELLKQSKLLSDFIEKNSKK